MEKIVLIPVPLDELQALITNCVNGCLKQSAQLAIDEKLLSPAEVCKMFHPNITKPTLHKWTKDGLIEERRIGRRVFYKHSDVIASLQTLKKYKRLPHVHH